MRKITTIYWGISSGLTIAFMLMSILIPNDLLSLLFFALIPIILLPNYIIRQNTRKKTKDIEDVYLKECDPFKYIESMDKNNKHNIQTTMSKYFYKIRKADFLCECSDFKEVRRLLEELLEVESEMNNALLSYYYKVWITYFLEFGNFERVEVLLEQMQQLPLSSSNRVMQNFCSSMYFTCLAKYNALTKRDIENTEKYFASMVNSNIGKAYAVSGMYYLALIAIEKGEYDKARRRSKYVLENGNKLSYARKIKPIIEFLNSNNNLSKNN